MSVGPRRAFLAMCTLIVALAARESAPQEASGPPPSSSKADSGEGLHELLPALGRIGAQVGVMGGASWNPYGVGPGVQWGGYVDLPLARVPGGKLSYEILLGLSHAKSDPFSITNPLAYLANIAAGADPAAALAGPPSAPFPVRRDVRTRLRLLQISPFALKYTIQSLDHVHLRPYAVAGLDFVVVISRQDPLDESSVPADLPSPFDGPLVGGVVTQVPELTARGLPTGQGNIEAGFHAGAGVEIRISHGLSLNLEYRFTGIDGTKARLHTASSALAFHW